MKKDSVSKPAYYSWAATALFYCIAGIRDPYFIGEVIGLSLVFWLIFRAIETLVTPLIRGDRALVTTKRVIWWVLAVCFLVTVSTVFAETFAA